MNPRLAVRASIISTAGNDVVTIESRRLSFVGFFCISACLISGLAGCSGAISTYETVLPKAPTANAGGPYNPQSQPLSYGWTFGDGATGTRGSPSHVYTSAGTYTISLVVTDTTGLTGSAISKASVAALTPPTANAGGPYSGTAGTAISFNGNGSSDPQSQSLSYLWTFGDGAAATGSSPSHDYFEAGDYVVSLTVTDTSGLVGTAASAVNIPENWGSSVLQLGDSITWGSQLGAPFNTNSPLVRCTQTYGALLANKLTLNPVCDVTNGFPITLLAIPGDTAADIFSRQIALTRATKPSVKLRQLFTFAIGTNDVAFGPGVAYSGLFRTLTEADLAWISTPQETSVLAGNGAFVLGNTTVAYDPFPTSVPAFSGTVSSNIAITGSLLAANGDVTITQITEGNPIYVFYLIGNSMIGNFTLSIDAQIVGIFNTNQPTISTNASQNASVAMVRLPVAAGIHTVTIIASQGAVGILGTSTIPAKNTSIRPTVTVLDIFPQNTSYTPLLDETTYAAYRSALQAGVTELQGDGADLRYVVLENYLDSSDASNYAPDGSGPGGASNPVHLSETGHAYVFQAVLASLLAAP
jgi:chitodextrinase